MPEQQQTTADWQPAVFETPTPNIARVYDYLLGGKDNYAPDRAVAQRIEQTLPEVHLGVKAQRAVLRRVVRHLVGEAGLRQLLDIGSGLPTADNVHQIAQAIDPATKVVYVDNDPVVLAHARALLADNRETVVVAGDLRNPAELLADERLREHLDFGQPVGLLLCGILHYVLDEEEPARVVRELVAELPSGSYVFIHHLLAAGDDAEAAATEAVLRQGVGRAQFRTIGQVAEFLEGLELVDPGVVTVSEWHPEEDGPKLGENPVLRLAAVGVARKP
ncbi:SAM-dependent methyltransferase [Kitasatospora sp. NBC_01287]|uniref:SAM-dependent methyltransferase n=1 Tax=Kitasatospora sp. NBC_01287 TaxID=2903573 RepID=UPI00224F5783|nr:SAM-dependent methyltransferase [Kitasatospora sp. NBC_01287]MCX4744249.1 SAM-dependent methyltransferase [Kitasatospora sp. NBC_01287]